MQWVIDRRKIFDAQQESVKVINNSSLRPPHDNHSNLMTLTCSYRNPIIVNKQLYISTRQWKSKHEPQPSSCKHILWPKPRRRKFTVKIQKYCAYQICSLLISLVRPQWSPEVGTLIVTAGHGLLRRPCRSYRISCIQGYTPRL